jgi:hypothetical protein
MNATLQWSLILGVLLPPLIAILQRPSFPSHLRAGITVVVCVAAGLVGLAIEGKLGVGAKTIVINLLVVIGAAVTFHEHVWKNLRVTPTIERATTPPARK